jgi:NADH-quinone oxidoreductase subunit J
MINFYSFFTSTLTGFFFLIVNILVSALMVLLAKNPINALFFLISTFFNTSIFLVILNHDFLAIVFVLIYIGAISVFFLFMIMMLNVNAGKIDKHHRASLLLKVGFIGVSFFTTFGILSCFLRVGLEKNLILAHNFTSSKFHGFALSVNTYELIGHFLYTYYSLSLLLVGIFLLVIMIGVIVLPVVVQRFTAPTKMVSSVFLKSI